MYICAATLIFSVIIFVTFIYIRLHKNKIVSDQSFERFWRIVEVVGLWAAAIVGVAAIAFSTHDSREQLHAIEAQLQEMRNASRSFVFLKSVERSFEPADNDELVKFKYTWKNNGLTPAYNLIIWSDCDFYAKVVDIKPQQNEKNQFRTFVGPGSEQAMIGCEESASRIRKYYNSEINHTSGKEWLFVLFGGASYSDAFNVNHKFQYCYQLWWDNEKNKDEFELIPCLNQNAKYNCVDRECGDN